MRCGNHDRLRIPAGPFRCGQLGFVSHFPADADRVDDGNKTTLISSIFKGEGANRDRIVNVFGRTGAELKRKDVGRDVNDGGAGFELSLLGNCGWHKQADYHESETGDDGD